MKKVAIGGLLSSLLLVGCNSGTSNASDPTVINHVYFTNLNNNSYTQCNVIASGIDSTSCVTTIPTGSGVLKDPFGIAFNGNYAYIVNNAESGSYTQCQVDSNSLILSSTCNTIVPSTDNGAMSWPEGVAFNGGYAYFINDFGTYANSYTQCNVTANGINPSSCSTITPTGNGALDGAGFIAFNNGYAYITNWDNNSYTQCNVAANGINPSTCNTIIPTGAGALDSPEGVAFNNNFAYFVNFDNNSYTQCSVTTNGIDVNSCNTVTPTGKGRLTNPFNVAFNGGYAYFVNGYSNSYTQCNVTSNGIDPSSCNTVIPTGSNALKYPIGIAFN